MNTEAIASRVREIQAITKDIREGTNSPGMQSCMHDIEVFCHQALNYLGETDSIVAEA